MSRQEIVQFLILRTIGNFLLLFAIFGVGATFGPVVYYEALFRVSEFRGVHYAVANTALTRITPEATNALNAGGGLGAVMSNNKEQVLVAPNTQFSLIIPKIGAAEQIIPNVDPTNPDIYLPALQKGIAHAKGSVFPGMNGTVYLFAHSTDNFWDVGRYNAVFYLLKDLGPGDDIVVFYENTRYNYKVVKTQIVDPSDVTYLAKAQESLKRNPQGTGDEQLVLQTCWPPGTTFKRLLVIAKPVGNL